jgi:hypothetical protein
MLATELEELVGKRTLNCVPITDVRHPFDADANGIAFTLDGNTYMVFEDGDDGYRSRASKMLAFEGWPFEMGGRVERCALEVDCSWRSASGGQTDEILEVRVARTGDLVLEVGTENTDDYYPCFIARWTPPSR